MFFFWFSFFFILGKFGVDFGCGIFWGILGGKFGVDVGCGTFWGCF